MHSRERREIPSINAYSDFEDLPDRTSGRTAPNPKISTDRGSFVAAVGRSPGLLDGTFSRGRCFKFVEGSGRIPSLEVKGRRTSASKERHHGHMRNHLKLTVLCERVVV